MNCALQHPYGAGRRPASILALLLSKTGKLMSHLSLFWDLAQPPETSILHHTRIIRTPTSLT